MEKDFRLYPDPLPPEWSRETAEPDASKIPPPLASAGESPDFIRGYLKAMKTNEEIRADERAKIRKFVIEETAIGLVLSSSLLYFLDSLDTPSKGEKE